MLVLSTKDYSHSDLVERISSIIHLDGLVVLPTDTVYGLCVDARSKKAVEKLIAFKNRPAGKPISVFVGNKMRAKEYVKITKKQEALFDRLTPGPYTFVLSATHQTQKTLESEKGTLGIRIPDHLFINELVNALGVPITATSANIAGTAPHYSIASLLNSLSQKKKDAIDLIVDGGKLPYNKPSTVIDLTGDDISIMRSGSKETHETFQSNSEKETKNRAVTILKKVLKKATTQPIVIILQGELGTGKTAFVKGIGNELGIKNIVSPTYVVCYEYKISNLAIKQFHHCDFYNIKEGDELNFLGIDQMLTPHTLVAIEWGEKSGSIFELLRKKALVVIVHMKYKSQSERIIEVTYL